MASVFAVPSDSVPSELDLPFSPPFSFALKCPRACINSSSSIRFAQMEFNKKTMMMTNTIISLPLLRAQHSTALIWSLLCLCCCCSSETKCHLGAQACRAHSLTCSLFLVSQGALKMFPTFLSFFLLTRSFPLLFHSVTGSVLLHLKQQQQPEACDSTCSHARFFSVLQF